MKMIEVKSYRNLTGWQNSMDLVVSCDQLTSQFPKTEIYGLSRKAEGKGRNSEILLFLNLTPDT